MAELTVPFHGKSTVKVVKWKAKKGMQVGIGTVLATYQYENSDNVEKLKCNVVGTVLELLVPEGACVKPGGDLLRLQGCTHATVMKDMCAACGADLRELGVEKKKQENKGATVAMVHSIPELVVSEQEALTIGQEDEERLLKNRKLTLLVDLDQTLIHTTNENIPPNLKDVYHFQLWHGRGKIWYHTKFRPGIEKFLDEMSKLFELHICSFGVRLYAHTIARFVDPDGKYFSHRILSRDECFDPTSKTANLKALFPCGDSMVCIIDDREDVWSFIPNLIHVKPYVFFDGTADINAPPIGQDENHENTENNRQRKSRVIRVRTTSKSDDENKLPKEEVSKDEANKENKSDVVTTAADEVPNKDSQASEQVKSAEKDKKEEDVKESEKKNSVEDMEVDPSGDGEEVKEEESCSGGGEKDSTVLFSGGEKQAGEDSSGGEKKESSQLPSGGGDNPYKATEKVPADTGKSEDKESTGKESVPADKELEEGELAKSPENSDGEDYEEMLEWEDTDDYLLYLADILMRIHTAFYEVYDQAKGKDATKKPDLKNIIPYVRNKILKGKNIVFSGVFPLNANPKHCRPYQLAVAMGANVQTDIVAKDKNKDKDKEATTHLVAAKLGTSKVHIARKLKHIKVVTPEWLFSCAERWELVEERIFLLKGDKSDKRSCDSPFSSQTKTKRTQATEKSRRKDKNRESGEPMGISERRLSDTISPLAAFSSDEIADMDKEVEEIFDESDSSDSDSELRKKVLKSRESSSEDSLSGEFPKGWSRKRKRPSDASGEGEDEDDKLGDGEVGEDTSQDHPYRVFRHSSSSSSDSDNDSEKSFDSIGSMDEEMIAAVEKEFLA